MKLRDVNTVSSIHRIYVPPTIIKQFLKMIENLDSYIEDQDLSQLDKDIQTHVEIEGNVHNVHLSESDLHKLLTKLYLEWRQKYPEHDYETFLKNLVDEYQYFLTTAPDNLTEEQKTKYLITVCALTYYFNKVHGITDTAHNGLFASYIDKIKQNITVNDYIKDVYFYFNVFNTADLHRTMENELADVINDYYNRKQNYQQQDTGNVNQYFLGIPGIYESLDYLINSYEELLQWQYNWEHRRTIGLISIFTIENLPYYQPIYVKDKLVFNENTELFLNFTYGICDGITHLFTIRNTEGKLILSIYSDSRNMKIYLAVNSNDSTQLDTYPIRDLNSGITNYKLSLRTSNHNRSLQCVSMVNNSTGTIQQVTFENLPKLPYFPEYIDIPFKFDIEDKVKYNSYHELLAYNVTYHPELHNQLFKIN